ncbi:MAG: response regulator transcription factor [Butyrivibrio sp.]|nr:response regulator transcription factor [Butyrivibrio sp.]
MPLLFLIDDDHDVLILNKKYFQNEGYQVMIFDDAVSAIHALLQYPPSCIVLDIMMPEMNGFTALSRIRSITKAPVIFLTGKDSEDDRVNGLIAGASDYLVKPYSLRELSARIQVQLRKTQESAISVNQNQYNYPPLSMNFAEHKVFYNNTEEIILSNREYELLYFFMSNPGHEISYRQMGEYLYHIYNASDRRTLMVIVSRLRKKLSDYDGLENIIESIYGKGYKFTPEK